MRTVLKSFLIGLAFYLPAAGSAAAAETKAVVILDATAQMSAKFGQRSKIEAVKAALGGAATRMDAGSQLAVWAFGSNPPKKCEDKGELLALKPAGAAAAALDKALSAVQPRAARSPVSATLRAALEGLGGPKDAAVSAIIIAGTGDDCGPAICDEAKSLRTAFPNAKLTVLGIAMSEQNAAAYTCAAKAMAGEFTAVKTAADLDKLVRLGLGVAADAKPGKAAAAQQAPAEPAAAAALAGEKKVAAGTPLAQPSGPAMAAAPAAAPAEAKPGAEASPPPPEVKPAPQPEPNAVLTAVAAEGQPPLEAGVSWEVFKINTTATGQLKPAETPSWTGGGGKAQARLAEGRYIVRVAYGYASAEDNLSVTAGAKAEKTVVLHAGTISVEGLQTKSAGAAEGVIFTLSRRKEAGGGLEELGRSSRAPAIFLVNAGDYILSAVAGPAMAQSAVKAEAGKVATVRLAFNTGTLVMKARETEAAGKAVPARHRIFLASAKAGAPLMTIEGEAQVQLPAGGYRVESEYGQARVENTIVIGAGQTLEQPAVLSAGAARIVVPAGKPARVCALYEAGANRDAGPAAKVAGTDMSLVLKAGMYDVECRSQGAPLPVKPVQLRVVAGEIQETKLAE